jgi:hypothetical protein
MPKIPASIRPIGSFPRDKDQFLRKIKSLQSVWRQRHFADPAFARRFRARVENMVMYRFGVTWVGAILSHLSRHATVVFYGVLVECLVELPPMGKSWSASSMYAFWGK